MNGSIDNLCNSLLYSVSMVNVFLQTKAIIIISRFVLGLIVDSIFYPFYVFPRGSFHTVMLV